jgi:hypothetical protein
VANLRRFTAFQEIRAAAKKHALCRKKNALESGPPVCRKT